MMVWRVMARYSVFNTDTAGGIARLLWWGKASGRCTGRGAASQCHDSWYRSLPGGLTWTSARWLRISARVTRS